MGGALWMMAVVVGSASIAKVEMLVVVPGLLVSPSTVLLLNKSMINIKSMSRFVLLGWLCSPVQYVYDLPS